MRVPGSGSRVERAATQLTISRGAFFLFLTYLLACFGLVCQIVVGLFWGCWFFVFCFLKMQMPYFHPCAKVVSGLLVVVSKISTRFLQLQRPLPDFFLMGEGLHVTFLYSQHTYTHNPQSPNRAGESEQSPVPLEIPVSVMFGVLKPAAASFICVRCFQKNDNVKKKKMSLRYRCRF